MQDYDELIDAEKLAEGSQDAFRRLFMKYYPKVRRFIDYLVKSEAVAEDLSQDVFESLWTNREYLPNIKSLNAYLFGMAKNKSINYLNHKTVEEDYASSYVDLPEYGVEEEIDAKELELLVLLTVEKMPEQRRRIFEMSRIRNLKNTEIAEELNLSKKTVENHLNLAIREIKRIITLLLLFF
ncbi:MAG: RNA polymerase sigma-70 factor [Tannerella sp.]|jgi:RNA polymerase sigma-70 factor (ECF subfamily)|nr:RNA polymerase sigma-70 factor [Tannerella sp.]